MTPSDINTFAKDARRLLKVVLRSLDPEAGIDMEDYREELEELLGVTQTPTPDVTEMVRKIYARSDRLALEDLYGIAAKRGVAPAEVDRSLKQLKASIKYPKAGDGAAARYVVMPL